MHSKIFQISTVKVTDEGRLTENTLTQGDGSFYDYCMEIEPDIRKQCIDILVNRILPSGMFELTGEDTLIYKGGAEQWKKEFVAYIQAKASELTTENVQDWIGPVYQKPRFNSTWTKKATREAQRSHTSSCAEFVKWSQAQRSISVA